VEADPEIEVSSGEEAPTKSKRFRSLSTNDDPIGALIAALQREDGVD
jgi:hypothetical protein